MVIDDNPEDRAEARRMLLQGAARRYLFTEAENGASGIVAVRTCPGGAPDCVLLDYDLPDMLALDVLAELADADGLQRCPVVVMTGSDATEPGRRVLRAGAHDYIGKDWMTPAALTRAIDNATERWVMGQELRAREAELEMLANNVPDVLARFDRQLRYVFANPAIESILGRPSAAVQGRTNRELGMPVVQREQSDGCLRAVFASGLPQSFDFEVTGARGLRQFSSRLVPEFAANAQVQHVLAITHDTTDHVRSERTLREADRRKDEFIATLAHELRNPLAPLLNGLSLLRMGIAPAQRELTVAMMSRQLANLVNLVEDLLDVSRLNLDKIVLRSELLDLDQVVAEAVEGCTPLINARNHMLGVERLGDPITVRGDRTRLVQIVANVLTNAAKYTDSGGHLQIGLVRDGAAALIRITDNGVGIATEALPTLWNMFTQVRDTIEKAQGGLGIGLSLVKKLVELHSGTVKAESRGVGCGSTFTISLPLAAAVPGGAGVAPAQPDVGSTPPLRPRRVLVVDDNTDTAQSLATMVQFWGHETVMAHNGLDALARAAAFHPDLVLLDIGLPGLDGYAVARQLRARPAAARVLLAAITGWGDADDKRKAVQAGFDFHLTKPVAAKDIQALLQLHPARIDIIGV